MNRTIVSEILKDTFWENKNCTSMRLWRYGYDVVVLRGIGTCSFYNQINEDY